MQIFTLGRSAVNIEPAICNGHMPYLSGRAALKGEEGVGSSVAARAGEGDLVEQNALERPAGLPPASWDS